MNFKGYDNVSTVKAESLDRTERGSLLIKVIFEALFKILWKIFF